MKRIKGTNYGSKFLSKEEIECIEEQTDFKHIGTEVIKDSDLVGLTIIYFSGYLGNVNEDVIYIPFSHPHKYEYDYPVSVCEIFMKKKKMTQKDNEKEGE